MLIGEIGLFFNLKGFTNSSILAQSLIKTTYFTLSEIKDLTGKKCNALRKNCETFIKQCNKAIKLFEQATYTMSLLELSDYISNCKSAAQTLAPSNPLQLDIERQFTELKKQQQAPININNNNNAHDPDPESEDEAPSKFIILRGYEISWPKPLMLILSKYEI